MIFTYPLQLFVFRDTIEKALFGGRPFNRLRHITITVFTVCSTILAGCLTCDLGMVVEITGGVNGSAIALIVPCACYLKVHKIKEVSLSVKEKAPYLVIVGIGFSFMVLTVASQIISAFEEKKVKICAW